MRLVDAAVDVFASKGYYAATTRAVATTAGLSNASLYVAFESNDHLLRVQLLDVRQCGC